MLVLVGEGDGYHHPGRLQHVGEHEEGRRAADGGEHHRLVAEGGAQGLRHHGDVFVVQRGLGGGQAGVLAYLDVAEAARFQVPAQQLRHLLRQLAGHQAHVDEAPGLVHVHVLAAVDVAGVQAADVAGGLEHVVVEEIVRLAALQEVVHAPVVQLRLHVQRRQRRQRVQLLLRGHGGLVIEAVDEHRALGLLDGGEGLHQPPGGAGAAGGVLRVLGLLHRAAGELNGAQALEPELDGGPAGGVHAGVRADDQVRGELLLVALDEGQQVGAALLLLALEDVLEVDGQLVELAVGLLGLDVREKLPLVVADAAAVEPPAAHLRVVGVGVPHLQRALGHHVVMAVDEQRGGVLHLRLHLAHDDGVAAGQRVQAVGDAGVLHLPGEELRALLQPLMRHAHALVLYQRYELVHILLLVGLDIVVYLFEIVHHDPPVCVV